LTSEHAPVRRNAVGLLGDIAQEHPALVIDHATEIADCLTDDAADTRRNATITLLRAGEANPSAVKAEHEALSTALNDEDSTVRANACTLIGNTHAPVSVDRLQTLRDTDPNDRVQEEAARALNRIN
ncbi:HEAT repeat domain-containing protein, partial [Halorubrum sp. AD140]|uniref:HEAT repeat domain-containing protein n=1 Tax=Halorubrum sp. AD140 TaxID=3050073 RepID=UPI002ACCAF08